MNSQKGMATLLITTMLLVVSLLFSLASYKNTFYQIKRTQNEVLARQAHWAAEGGLECAFAKVSIDRDLSKLDYSAFPNYLETDCTSKLDLNKIEFTHISGGKYNVSSEYLNHAVVTLSKKIDFTSTISSGTIKSTADIFINGAAVFNPPDPGDEADEGWECKVARYKRHFVINGSISNMEFAAATTPPSSDFKANGKGCLPTHKSTSTASLKKDFEKNIDINPFKEFFSEEKANWGKVRDSLKYKFGIVNATVNVTGSVANRVPDCANEIKTHIDNGKLNVWVEGSCELTGTGITGLASASQSTPGVLIVVHNGVFSINGSAEIKGVLFHFNDPATFTPSAADWLGLDANGILAHVPTVFDVMLNNTFNPAGDSTITVPSAKDAAYFQNGSFSFTGGQFYDLDGQLALFNNGLDLKFNSDVINRTLGTSPPKWVEGSWHDF